MKLSDGVEWGLHAATLLSFLPAGEALPARRLAEYHGVPEAYMAKHLQAMARAGVLRSVPGPRGGFSLARPANRITVLDVVEAIDGTTPAFRCDEIRQRGPARVGKSAYSAPCAIHRVMDDADAAWRESLRGVTVADLASEITEVAAPQALKKGAAWLTDVLGSR